MTGPPQPPRWRALEIGPGGRPADQVRSVGPDGGPSGATAGSPHTAGSPDTAGSLRTAGSPDTAAHAAASAPAALPIDNNPVRQPSTANGSQPPAAPAGPSAVFGSFDDGPRKQPRKALLAVLVLAVVLATVTISSLWAGDRQSADSAADLRPADCLSSADDRSVIVVDCASPDVEFSLAAKYDNTRDAARCSTISTDLVLVTTDNTVLCLNYRASVGDCLYAGDAGRIGKAPCREPGSSTPFGLYRVIAVLPDTVDVRGCPRGTITTLVHLVDSEVLCLGMP